MIFAFDYERFFILLFSFYCIEVGVVVMAQNISTQLSENVQLFEQIFNDCADVKKEKMKLGKACDVDCYLAYIEVTVSNVTFADSVIGKTLNTLIGLSKEEVCQALKHNNIGLSDITKLYTMDDAVNGMLTGDAVLFVDGCDCAFKIAATGYPKMNISKADSEQNIRGSKEGFNDSVKANTALIRKRIRSPRLKVKEMTEGLRSNTTIAVVYIEDIVEKGLVERLEQQLSEYEMDGVFDSGMLIQLIEQSKDSPFPQYQTTERPDRAAMAVLEGRVVLLVDNSPTAVLLPSNYNSFFVTTDDYYSRWEIATLERLIRYMASILAMFLPAMYLAVIKFHAQVLPVNLVLTFASARKGVPFSAFVEVLIMELAFELLREAGIRIPGNMGNAIGIVGGLIVGQAAVDAGLISPIVVIVVALTALASFAVPNEELGSAFRLVKFGLLLISALFGFYGVVLGMILLLLHLCDLKSLGKPFLVSSYRGRKKQMEQASESVIRKPAPEITQRSVYAEEKEKIRLKKKEGKQ